MPPASIDPANVVPLPPLVFLPGWGFDAQVLDLAPAWPGRLIRHALGEPQTAVEQLRVQLDQAGIQQVDLCGWSLGARVALDFHAAHPGRIRRLLLVSLRPKFAAREIEAERSALLSEPRGHLAAFYRRAFLGQKADGVRFAERLLPRYLELAESVAHVDRLLTGLDYLADRAVSAEELASSRARLFHGERDLIAPVAELQACLGAQDVPLHVQSGAGHVPVVTEAFAAWLATSTAETRPC